MRCLLFVFAVLSIGQAYAKTEKFTVLDDKSYEEALTKCAGDGDGLLILRESSKFISNQTIGLIPFHLEDHSITQMLEPDRDTKLVEGSYYHVCDSTLAAKNFKLFKGEYDFRDLYARFSNTLGLIIAEFKEAFCYPRTVDKTCAGALFNHNYMCCILKHPNTNKSHKDKPTIEVTRTFKDGKHSLTRKFVAQGTNVKPSLPLKDDKIQPFMSFANKDKAIDDSPEAKEDPLYGGCLNRKKRHFSALTYTDPSGATKVACLAGTQLMIAAQMQSPEKTDPKINCKCANPKDSKAAGKPRYSIVGASGECAVGCGRCKAKEMSFIEHSQANGWTCFGGCGELKKSGNVRCNNKRYKSCQVWGQPESCNTHGRKFCFENGTAEADTKHPIETCFSAK